MGKTLGFAYGVVSYLVFLVVPLCDWFRWKRRCAEVN